MPAMPIGTADRMVVTLYERRETFGFSYFVVGDADLEPLAPIVHRLSGK